MAVYTFGLECGKMLALPTWLRVVSAYSVAAIVPMLLPSAHGDNCRVATVVAASTLAATRVSIGSAIGVSIVLWLCPARVLWWPKNEDTDSVTALLRDIVKWMDAHVDVLPTRHKQPTPTQKEETALKIKYGNYVARASDLTKEQRALQQEIDR